MTRRAFVGYSTPIGYDYKNSAQKILSTAEVPNYPNPILDSPFGLMILFDEIVFASRSLCPANMSKAPFVRFLDEEGMAPDLRDIDYDILRDAAKIFDKLSFQALKTQPAKNFIGWKELKYLSGVYWEEGIDNHSSGITVGGLTMMGNQTFENMVLDEIILERLGDSSLELVSNSILQQYVDINHSPLGQAKLAEQLTINNIHSYQSPSGPYHPIIDEVREYPYISDFREWLSQQTGSIDSKELKEAKNAVEASLQKAQDELFLKYLDPKGYAINIGKSVLLDIAGSLLPGIGIGASILEEWFSYNQTRKLKWQGFLVSVRDKI